MRRSTFASALSVVLLVIASAAPAHAAQDGTLGATSTGSINVRATIVPGPPSGVRISGLTDMDFGDIPPATGFNRAISLLRDVCLYHSSPTFGVSITQTGGGIIRLSRSGGGVLPVALAFTNLSGTVTETPPVTNTANAVFSGLVGNRVSETCASGPQQKFGVVVEVLAGAAAGAYSTTLNLTITPE